MGRSGVAWRCTRERHQRRITVQHRRPNGQFVEVVHKNLPPSRAASLSVRC